MSLELLRTLTLWLAALALLVGGAYLGVSRLRARRRPEREALWKELCLRLELVPDPANRHSAKGVLQGTDFALHDTGSAWLVELPLPQPLLPSAVLLLPAKEWRLQPPFKLRRLQWTPAPPPLSPFVWYVNHQVPPSSVEAAEPFLQEAARAAEAHAPLRVEPRRLVHALPLGLTPSVNDVREAVRALEPTAQRWLDVVARYGLPRVKELPRLPSALSLLNRILGRRSLWHWILANNAGVPLVLGALGMGWNWGFAVLLIAALFLTRKAAGKESYGGKAIALGGLALSSTFLAPLLWTYDNKGPETSPPVLSVREAPGMAHRQAKIFRFRDANVRADISSRNASLLHPVVPSDWKHGEPVTVFAVRSHGDRQKHPTLGGFALPVKDYLRTQAITLALENEFAVHPHAVFVDFAIHPDDFHPPRKKWAIFLWSFPNLLWIGVVLFRWRQEFRQSRQERKLRVVKGGRQDR
jgi:hypothetical protein